MKFVSKTHASLVLLGTIASSLLPLTGLAQTYSHLPHDQSVIIQPVNHQHIEAGDGTTAIENVTIIDGRGGSPLENGTVLVEGSRIRAVGHRDEVNIPNNTTRIDGTGQVLLPGLIDAHFHLNNKLVLLFLQKGITTLRDPGAWIETYGQVRASGETIPRLYLTGPHFDMGTPAYPKNSVIIRDPLEADYNVRLFADQGASAIKVYFRCSLEIIEQICQTSDQLGIPVTGHLEITDIYNAVNVGIDGLEHITSLGTTLIPKREAEAYRQRILADNGARKMGRYEMWRNIDVEDKPAGALADFLAAKRTFVCPTLGAFEYQMDPDKPDTVKYEGFQQMLAYNKVLFDHGVHLVLGSHSWSPYDKLGGAYHNEMELWQECGIPPMDIIHASTLQNAKFLRVEDQLGSIEPGKIADLFLIEGDPLQDISAMRNVKKVMLNGKWLNE
ncbi:MAG: amidohydrolase family protein [Saprospiraceae bacterium]|nr:amidohydrolase family protein [Saprospiraceae bacterium]